MVKRHELQININIYILCGEKKHEHGMKFIYASKSYKMSDCHC